MANAELSIWVKLKDDASQAISGLSGKINDLQPAFKTMSVVGTAAFGAVSAIAYKTIKDFQGAETAQKQLEHATLQVAHGTREQLKALQDLSVELEKKGVLDGDAIAVGLAQLQTFGLSSDMVKKLGGSMADLAVNQFGVNASSEQLSQTANIMAKALNGQFGVLEKSGIRFTDAQKHMIEFGTETQKVQAIQEGFAQNLKFTNEVAVGTLEGGMAKLNVQLGNVSENIGAALAPALTQLMEKATPMINKVVEWTAENPKLVTTILAVTAGVAAVVAGLGFFGLILPSVITGVTMLGTALMFLTTNPIGLTILAIAGLIAIGIALWKNWDTVKAKAAEIWNAIRDFFKAHWDEMLIIFTGGIGAVVVGIIKNWDTIKGATIASWNAIRDFFKNIWEDIKNIWNSAIKWLMDKIKPLLNALDRLQSSGVVNSVKGGISKIGDIFRANGGPVMAGNPYIVGERGPELFVPSASGKIIPNGAMAGGGSAVIVNVNGGNYLDRDAARMFGNELAKLIKLNQRV